MTHTPEPTPRPFAALTLAVVLAGGLAVSMAPPTAPASAQTAVRNAGAEDFVQSRAKVGLSILNDNGRPDADKSRLFRAFVDQVADVPRITNFVLGKYGRSITPAQREQFAAVFHNYATNVYESRLDEYKGSSLKVTGSISRSPTDVVVNSMMSGGKLDKPELVAWRVINTSGTVWKVVDVQVKGVWLAITQQQDFVSTIDNAGGNIDVLIAQLQRQIKADSVKS